MPAMLIRVTVRMPLVPRPRGADDLLKFWKLRSPIQVFECAVGRSHEARRITGAARLFDKGNFLFGNFLAHVDHLPHGITGAVAEVVETLLARFEREHVRLRKIDDMDVIANAGAVVRR